MTYQCNIPVLLRGYISKERQQDIVDYLQHQKIKKSGPSSIPCWEYWNGPSNRMMFSFADGNKDDFLKQFGYVSKVFKSVSQIMGNWYVGNHSLSYHQDIHPKCMVINLNLQGRLDFVRNFKSYEVPRESKSPELSFLLNPGDAVMWTKDVEEYGWHHGGFFEADRMSLVVRGR